MAAAMRPVPPQERRPLDAQAALSSALRTWLVLRDTVLWNFSGGDGGVKLPVIDAQAVARQIEQLNQQRDTALALAQQIADIQGDLTAQGVLNRELAGLLAAETPAFSLAVATVPGSF